MCEDLTVKGVYSCTYTIEIKDQMSEDFSEKVYSRVYTIEMEDQMREDFSERGLFPCIIYIIRLYDRDKDQMSDDFSERGLFCAYTIEIKDQMREDFSERGLFCAYTIEIKDQTCDARLDPSHFTTEILHRHCSIRLTLMKMICSD